MNSSGDSDKSSGKDCPQKRAWRDFLLPKSSCSSPKAFVSDIPNDEDSSMIDNLSVVELNHVYDTRGTDTRGTALKSINISARRGEMICIIGPSGCGKSTLIRALAGHLQPTSGHILINGQDLYANLASIQHYVSYIPQEDTFDPLLSVEENINFASAIRCPHMHLDQRKKHADSRLVELGLSECRQ